MFTLSISPIAFHIGTLSVYWYGVIYATALLASWIVATWCFRKLRHNDMKVPSPAEFDGFMFFGIISMLVGARLGHVLFFELDEYLKDPMEIFMIRNGGLSFHGACIGIASYAYFFVRKHKYSWKIMADVLCLAGSLGVGIGRVANFINQELYGVMAGGSNAVIFKYVDNIPRHPTQLYESFFEGFLNFWIMFIVFRIRGAKSMGTGIFVALFSIIYASSRFVIEFYKETERYIYFDAIYITTGQILSLALLIFGVLVLYYQEKTTD